MERRHCVRQVWYVWGKETCVFVREKNRCGIAKGKQMSQVGNRCGVEAVKEDRCDSRREQVWHRRRRVCSHNGQGTDVRIAAR